MTQKLKQFVNLLKTNHATFVKLSAEEKAKVERQHSQQLEAHRRYEYGPASIAFIENADGILRVNLETALAKLTKAHDEVIDQIRVAITEEAERIRASQAEKRHRLRLKTAIAVPTEKAAAMQSALAATKTTDEVMHLHADAISAKDEPAAYWLEQNAGAHIGQIGKEVDQARWEDLCEREYKRRGGAVLQEIKDTEDAIRAAESTAHRYRTTSEAKQQVIRWGGTIEDWIGLTDDALVKEL